MDNKKFEQLIDLIINENEEKASALFHEIVVEKSREIYESLMELDMEEGMGGQTGDLMDEISSEEEGMDVNFDDEEDMDMDDEEMDMDDEEETVDLDADEESDEESTEDLEDRVVDLEDKLEMLMAEFEEIMNQEGDEEEMSDEEDAEMSDEEDEEMSDEEETDEEEVDQDEETVSEEDMAVMEAINLLKVKGLYDSHIGGDNGDNAHSPVAFNSGQKGMASHPVKLGSDTESGKRTVNVKDVKDATAWKNVPAKSDQNLQAAPKPVHKDEASGVRSPVAESKRIAKKGKSTK